MIFCVVLLKIFLPVHLEEALCGFLFGILQLLESLFLWFVVIISDKNHESETLVLINKIDTK